MNIKMMDVNSLVPYENNPRNNENAIEPTAESIRQFGFKQPIVVDRNNIIIIGHTRLAAAKLLGMDKVPVLVADDLNDNEVKALRIMDNKTGELSTWNNDKLEEEYARIVQKATVDMSAFGFDIDVDSVLNKLDNMQRTQNINDCDELDLGDFGDENFKYICPNCGMRFNKGV